MRGGPSNLMEIMEQSAFAELEYDPTKCRSRYPEVRWTKKSYQGRT